MVHQGEPVFEAGKKYQHINAITTLGMEVIEIINRTDKLITMKVGFFHLKNGRSQFVGKGDGYIETVEMDIDKEKDWFIYIPGDYKPKCAEPLTSKDLDV